MSATKPKTENPFDREAAKPQPDMACLGKVRSIGDPKLGAKGDTVSFKIDFATAGAVPVKAGTFFTVSAEFLRPGFKVSELAELEDAQRLTFIYSSNIAAPADSKETPTLFGLSSCDMDKYAAVGRALQALYTDGKATDGNAIKQVLEEHLIGNEIGFWLRQDTNKIENADGTKTYELTGYWSVRAPKFMNSYFRPDTKGRNRALEFCAKSKVNPRTGEPYAVATFDATTSLDDIPAF